MRTTYKQRGKAKTADIGTLITSMNGDRENVSLIKITSRPLIKKRNQLSQFRCESFTVIPIMNQNYLGVFSNCTAFVLQVS